MKVNKNRIKKSQANLEKVNLAAATKKVYLLFQSISNKIVKIAIDLRVEKSV